MEKLITIMSLLSKNRVIRFQGSVVIDSIWNSRDGATNRVIDYMSDNINQYVRDKETLKIFGLSRLTLDRHIINDYHTSLADMYFVASSASISTEPYIWWDSDDGYCFHNLETRSLTHYLDLDMPSIYSK